MNKKERVELLCHLSTAINKLGWSVHGAAQGFDNAAEKQFNEACAELEKVKNIFGREGDHK